MEFQIYTMYVNREDILHRAIESIGKYQSKLVILDNSRAQDLIMMNNEIEVVKPPVQLYCNQSYNFILNMALKRKQDVFFIMHSDALASADIIEQMLQCAEENSRAKRRWGVLLSNYDVLCLCHTPVLRDFRWDPYLPLYYTDADFYYRLKLAGVDIIETHLAVQHQEGGSTTLHADAALEIFVETNFAAWRRYYMRKWGGERGQEVYVTPFNSPITEG